MCVSMESIRDMALTAFLGLAVFWDLAERRIPNALVGVFASAGVALALALDGGGGQARAVLGFGAGLGLLLLPFAWGVVGAGDAKFFGAVGAFVGPELAFRAFVLGTALGLPFALLAIWRARSAGATRPATLPYAVPLALGTLAALGLEWAGVPFL